MRQRTMTVSDIADSSTVHNARELQEALAKRYGDYNAFWIASEEGTYPQLGLFVQGHLAYLCYLPEEFDPGFRSMGEAQEQEAGPRRIPTSMHRTDDIVVPNDALVSYASALAAATEFFQSPRELPRSVKWLKL
jgi:hypothetical protein